MFEIVSLKVEDGNSRYEDDICKCLKVEVEFKTDYHDFGLLGEWHKGSVLKGTKEEYREHIENFKLEFEPIPDKPGFSRMVGDTAFDLGILEIADVQGDDSIEKIGEDTFLYTVFCTENKITRAAIDQLEDMKKDLKDKTSVFAKKLNAPGAYYSAFAREDFLKLLEILNMFWD